jgi:hypothetical protein
LGLALHLGLDFARSLAILYLMGEELAIKISGRGGSFG